MNNRFFTTNDTTQDKLIFEFDKTLFWSRLYEYPFALSFVKEGMVILDAACGSYHPFKFALTDITKEVYAVDICDLSQEVILKEIGKMFGKQSADNFDKSYFDKVHFEQCSITKMPYEDKKFDLVFCISVIEHLDEQTILDGLKEFKKALKDNGHIVITIDYPTLLPEKFIELVNKVGLEFDGEYDYSIPENAINSTYFNNLYCYSAVLKKPMQLKKSKNKSKI